MARYSPGWISVQEEPTDPFEPISSAGREEERGVPPPLPVPPLLREEIDTAAAGPNPTGPIPAVLAAGLAGTGRAPPSPFTGLTERRLRLLLESAESANNSETS